MARRVGAYVRQCGQGARIFSAAVGVTALFGAGFTDHAPATEGAVKAADQPPVPGRVAVAGDSLSLQAWSYGDMTARGWDGEGKIGLGWEAEDAYSRVAADVGNPARSPDFLVVALGHNDALGPGGFTKADQLQVVQLALAPHASACTVLIMPYYAGADDVRTLWITFYRDWVVKLDQRYDRIVRADWAPVARAHPEYLDSDGIHLRDGSGRAASAYLDVMQTGIDDCR